MGSKYFSVFWCLDYINNNTLLARLCYVLRCLFVIWQNLILSYNVETGEKVAEFEGCNKNIVGAGLHPTNSMLLVACSVTGEIVMWKWQAQLLLSKNVG